MRPRLEWAPLWGLVAPWGLMALSIGLAGCAEEAAPPQAVTPAAAPVAAPTAAAEPTPWPQVFDPDAWQAVVGRLRAGAALPKVPTDSATRSQAQALARARTLTQRLGLRRDNPALAQSLARLYAENLFPDRAMAVLGLCLELDPEQPLTLKLAAVSLNAAGRFDEGTPLLEYLTRITPTDQGLAGPLFNGYWELGELDAARVALERGLEIAPFNPNLELALGRVLFEADRAEEALAHFKTAATGLPSSTEAWYRYATCLEELGHDAEASDARVRHSRLIQMEEFGIGSALPEGQRRRALVRALEESGDHAGAEAERAALVADGMSLD